MKPVRRTVEMEEHVTVEVVTLIVPAQVGTLGPTVSTEVRTYECVSLCVCGCVRACMRSCVHVCTYVRVYACAYTRHKSPVCMTVANSYKPKNAGNISVCYSVLNSRQAISIGEGMYSPSLWYASCYWVLPLDTL